MKRYRVSTEGTEPQEMRRRYLRNYRQFTQFGTDEEPGLLDKCDLDRMMEVMHKSWLPTLRIEVVEEQ